VCVYSLQYRVAGWTKEVKKKNWDPRAKGSPTQDWTATGRVKNGGELSVLPHVLVRERSGALRDFVLWLVGYGPNSFLAELPTQGSPTFL
jgi:hypothetical protein